MAHRRDRRGGAILHGALAEERPGAYQIQAAIAALHDDAPTAAETDWVQILAWYDDLVALSSTPSRTRSSSSTGPLRWGRSTVHAPVSPRPSGCGRRSATGTNGTPSAPTCTSSVASSAAAAEYAEAAERTTERTEKDNFVRRAARARARIEQSRARQLSVPAAPVDS